MHYLTPYLTYSLLLFYPLYIYIEINLFAVGSLVPLAC